ncbi:ribonuclease HI [Candidatus Nomurabacteria bacterium]|nr:ribonuclease HI [Candidatus Nomurabacteria bacterium]
MGRSGYYPVFIQSYQDGIGHMINLTIYTDGSCNARTGFGGAGAYIIHAGGEAMISEGFLDTKTGRMEIMAVILALESIKPEKRLHCKIQIYSDSQYVVNSINKWLRNWVIMGLDGRTNGDLWKRYLAVAGSYTKGAIRISWVRGHNGLEGNEIADSLANGAYKSGQYKPDR